MTHLTDGQCRKVDVTKFCMAAVLLETMQTSTCSTLLHGLEAIIIEYESSVRKIKQSNGPCDACVSRAACTLCRSSVMSAPWLARSIRPVRPACRLKEPRRQLGQIGNKSLNSSICTQLSADTLLTRQTFHSRLTSINCPKGLREFSHIVYVVNPHLLEDSQLVNIPAIVGNIHVCTYRRSTY